MWSFVTGLFSLYYTTSELLCCAFSICLAQSQPIFFFSIVFFSVDVWLFVASLTRKKVITELVTSQQRAGLRIPCACPELTFVANSHSNWDSKHQLYLQGHVISMAYNRKLLFSGPVLHAIYAYYMYMCIHTWSWPSELWVTHPQSVYTGLKILASVGTGKMAHW